MQVDRKALLEKICTGVDRPVLSAPFLVQHDKEGNFLGATNGKCLVLVPATLSETDDTKAKHISVEALQKARKLAGKQERLSGLVHGATILLEEKQQRLINNQTWPREDLGTPPNLLHEALQPAGDICCRVSFNPKLLLDMAQAMGWEKNDGVVLELRLKNDKPGDLSCGQPIKVTISGRAHESRGILMPMRTY